MYIIIYIITKCMKNKIETLFISVLKGNWNYWSNWSACSSKCGYGYQTRTRTCSYGHCDGSSYEKQDCKGSYCKYGKAVC